MLIQKRADEIVAGDVLYRSANDSTGVVVAVSTKHGMTYVNAGHFDREVPAGTMLNVYTNDDEPRTYTPRELERFRARSARRHVR
jgi:hypothetical protein